MKKIITILALSALSLLAIDVNTATKEDFMKIKGIGAKKAQRIINYRKEHGKFKSVDELVNVKGISKRLVEIIKKEGWVKPLFW